MREVPTAFEDVIEFVSEVHVDRRGYFYEGFSTINLPKFHTAQMNISLSKKGTIRGIHFAKNPPGQEKYVQCLEGEILDVVVDLRPDSSTFGQWTSITLSASLANALYVPNGFGHAFQTISETAKVAYLCSEHYSPENEFAINPLDPELAIRWPVPNPTLSTKDETAISFNDYFKVG